ncbi:hypothetical protein Tco_0615867 [Tanacetum coccineum]
MHNNIMAAGSKERPPMLGTINIFLSGNRQRRWWTAIEMLQQGESVERTRCKDHLFWEFGSLLLEDMPECKSISTLLTAAQPYSDNNYWHQSSKIECPINKPSLPHDQVPLPAHKGKEIANHYMAKIQEVSPAESSSTDTPLEQVQNHDENDVFANVRRHSEQPESINDTYVLEKDDSDVIPDSSNICTNDNQVQNAAEWLMSRAVLLAISLLNDS